MQEGIEIKQLRAQVAELEEARKQVGEMEVLRTRSAQKEKDMGEKSAKNLSLTQDLAASATKLA